MGLLLLTNNLILDENSAGQAGIEATEGDTEEADESYTDSTDEGTLTPALAGREHESVPHRRIKSKYQSTPQIQPARIKTQSSGRTHIRLVAKEILRNLIPNLDRTALASLPQIHPQNLRSNAALLTT